MRRAVTPRTVVRIGTAVLALVLVLLGVAVLAVHPTTRTRAEARFTVPAPLVVDDVIRAIRTHADGATATAHGRRVTVVSTDASRVAARSHGVALAHAGLDAALRDLTAVETRRAQAAHNDRSQAAVDLANLASRTGLTDPEPAYRAAVAAVQNLQEQRAAAASAGRPVAAIEAKLADKQQAVFELKLGMTRHADLIQAETRAGLGEREATRTMNASKRAVGSASIQVSDAAKGTGKSMANLVGDYGIQILTCLGALVIAGIVFLFSEPAMRREPEAAGENEEMARMARMAQAESEHAERAERESVDRRGPRYLEFYRALETSPQQPDPTPAAVDLVHQEALEAGAKSDPRRAAEQEKLPWPHKPAGEAKATRLSR